METIKLKVLNQTGHTLMTCDAGQEVSLVYTGAYQPGDRIAMEISRPGQFCVVQFEDTMMPALIYVAPREINFYIPFGEQAVIGYLYARESEFTAIRTILSGRMAGLDADTIRERLRECYA